MITFDQFQACLIKTETKEGAYYKAPLNHLISLHGQLFDAVNDARDDSTVLDIPKLCQFVKKSDKKDWKLFKLVLVEVRQ